jgi:RNA polymerase sigma-70 factor (ECF subfamily)
VPEATADRELVERCLGGDEAACAALLDRYQARLFTFILRMVADSRDAEDLCQDAFLKAFASLSSYDPSRPLISWLFRIGHNAAVDFLRAKKPETLSLDDADELLGLPDRGRSVEQTTHDAAEAESIEKLMAELPPLYREVLVLRHQEGMDYSGMADALGRPEGTVKNRLFRARDMLRKKLEAAGYAA